MKPLTDLEKLKEVLLNQAERGIKSGDWTELEAEQSRNGGDKLLTLEIKNLEVTFVFTLRGRLIGAYNWKQ